jgi:O-antigen/teichoic acid export membrane protein
MIRGGSLALGAVTAVVVARVLDPEGVAQALIAVSVGTMIGVIAQAGVPAAIAHSTARVRTGSLTEAGVGRQLFLSMAYTAVVLGAVVLAAVPDWPLNPERLIPGAHFALLAAAVVMAGGRAASRVLSETNKGFGHVTVAGFGSDLIGPFLGLAVIASLAALRPESLTGTSVAWALAAGWVAASAFAYWRAPIRPGVRRLSEPLDERFGSILGVVAIISILNVGIQQAHVVIAGAMLAVPAAAVFAAVARLAALTGTPLVLISAIASPDVGVALQSGDPVRIRALERRLQRLTGVLLVLGLGVAGVFAAAGSWILRILFGVGYEGGNITLLVLSLGPLASLSTGVAGLCLMQAGRRASVLRDTLIGSLLSIGGMVIGATLWSGSGLAVGYAAGQLLMNLMLLRTCRREVGIAPYARPIEGIRWALNVVR